MKKLFHLLSAIVLLAACFSQSQRLEISVANPSDFDRINELVEIPLDEIQAKISLSGNQVYEVRNAAGKVIPSQLTFDGKLIFQAGIKAGETLEFTLAAGNKQDFKALTYGRFIQERKDDFAWENDRVAFRIYGRALLPVDGPSNGLDIWYKRTNELIIDKWYKNDLAGLASYHKDNGEGLDDYKVGRTLGAGAMAPYPENKLCLNDNYVSQEIMDNGPLRTTFRLTYKDLNVDGKTLSESRTFSIDAGSQLTKVIQEYGVADNMTVAAGIIKREKNDSILYSGGNPYLIYVEPSPNAGTVFIGLLFPNGIDSVKVAEGHVLAISEYQPGHPFTYFTGYGWTKFGFADENEFQVYLDTFVKSLQQAFEITIK
jgi:hypothetical protein